MNIKGLKFRTHHISSQAASQMKASRETTRKISGPQAELYKQPPGIRPSQTPRCRVAEAPEFCHFDMEKREVFPESCGYPQLSSTYRWDFLSNTIQRAMGVPQWRAGSHHGVFVDFVDHHDHRKSINIGTAIMVIMAQVELEELALTKYVDLTLEFSPDPTVPLYENLEVSSSSWDSRKIPI